MKRYYDQIIDVWNYLKLHQTVTPSDAIFLLGSSDLRVAERAAELYKQSVASKVIISGNVGRMAQGLFASTEAEALAQVAIDCGVAKSDILLETKATNTGENIRFTQKLVAELGLDIKTITLVQKPYMERRALATFRQLWPQVSAQVTSPQFSFLDYCCERHPLDEVVNLMLGELSRLLVYPQLGYFSSQPWSMELDQAYQALTQIGFDQHILADVEL